jgi:hypothetical protein
MLSMPRIVRPNLLRILQTDIWFPRWDRQLVDPLSETKNSPSLSLHLRHRQGKQFLIFTNFQF